MGRNNHNKIRSSDFKSRHFNLEEIKQEVKKIQGSSEAAILLNMVLLLLPWAALFSLGVIVSPVYAQGGTDVSTELDTLLFVFGGIATFILVVVFAILLRGKSKK